MKFADDELEEPPPRSLEELLADEFVAPSVKKEAMGGKLTEAAKKAERDGRREQADYDFGTYITEDGYGVLCAYCDARIHPGLCLHMVN